VDPQQCTLTHPQTRFPQTSAVNKYTPKIPGALMTTKSNQAADNAALAHAGERTSGTSGGLLSS